MDVGEFPSAYGRSDSPGYERGGAPYDGELQQAADQLQRENAYLVERVKSFEKGLMSIYQLLSPPERPPSPHHRLLSYRSASQHFKLPTHPHSSLSQSNSYKGEDAASRQVSLAEVQEGVAGLVREREAEAQRLDELRQVTEAAKRERVLAIDEKDKLLHSSHLLKVALERKEMSLKEAEGEREELLCRCREVQEEAAALHRANEEARQTRSLALEQRAKVIEELSHLKRELTRLQAEREQLYTEKVQFQSALQELAGQTSQRRREVDRMASQCANYEIIARSLKEQNEVLNGRERETHSMQMQRHSVAEPWGFSIEGGQRSEFFHQDPSIVVTGIAANTPAEGILHFGDRILSVGRQDFTTVSRKQAADMLRACDQLSVTMEISRSISRLQPLSLEVKIPGRKSFGFTYETRLFISTVDEGSTASDWLLPGDEIVQVVGKPATNMKLSLFKQLLKASRDGIAMTIHRLPLSGQKVKRDTNGDTSYSNRSTCDPLPPLPPPLRSTDIHRSPGTPSSNVSEASAGYHSSHSLPSVSSNSTHLLLPEVGVSREAEAGTEHEGVAGELISPRLPSRGSGYETDVFSLESSTVRSRSSSAGSTHLVRVNSRPRPRELHPPPRSSFTLPGPVRHTSSSRYPPPVSPTARFTPSSDAYSRYPRGHTPRAPRVGMTGGALTPGSVGRATSASSGNLDSGFGRLARTLSHDYHPNERGVASPVAPPTSRPRQAISLSSMNTRGHASLPHTNV